MHPTILDLYPDRVRVSERPSIFGLSSRCWIWTGATSLASGGGYGVVIHEGQKMLAHRLSASLGSGVPRTAHVCHRCDVPACVNPEHLFIGTASDNQKDRRKWSSLLPPETIEEIRQSKHLTDKFLARKYKITLAEVSAIKARNHRLMAA